MWKSFITNWTTSVPALLIAICTATGLADIVPSEYYKYLMAVCGFLTTAGFLAAKSANVSNAPNPVAAAAVTEAAAAKPNPSVVIPPAVK
jgi:hypothetical protein